MKEKNNERIWKLLRLWPIAVAIIAVVAGYTTLGSRVEYHEKRIEEVEIRADANEKEIIGMRKDIEYIKKGVDKINEKLEK